MANIKSAKKRILQTRKKTEFNRFIKSRVRTKIKKIFSLIKAKSKDIYNLIRFILIYILDYQH